ncbi:hypothetical protein DMUE_6194 [Dictyocoela muelleri]|nr:hypothetical protein DMUE_6194 [Dictyocoela muelleri]
MFKIISEFCKFLLFSNIFKALGVESDIERFNFFKLKNFPICSASFSVKISNENSNSLIVFCKFSNFNIFDNPKPSLRQNMIFMLSRFLKFENILKSKFSSIRNCLILNFL